jgi:glucose-6-phosphate dehydrogenase assembly protein OpcA
MARAVAQHTWRTSTPEAIEHDLAALWREIGHGEATIARAVMSNLVVFRKHMNVPDADVAGVTADLPLDEVTARHPSRLIVLEHEYGQATPRAPFAAGVGIVTFGPPQGRYGVEQIVVRSACAEQSLPSILRRLLRGDVPTTVWWTEDLSERPPIDALITIGRQLLYDSRAWRDVRRGLAALAPLVAARRVDLADLNWRRLAPMRQALVHVRGPLGSASWQDAAVRVLHSPGEAALAWLLAGWLQTGRRSADATIASLEPSLSDDPGLTVIAGDMTAIQTKHTVEVTGGSAPPLVMATPSESDADAVAAELRVLSRDVSLDATLNALLRMYN